MDLFLDVTRRVILLSREGLTRRLAPLVVKAKSPLLPYFAEEASL